MTQVVWVSSFPPRQCGVASYTHELVKALRASHPTITSTVAAVVKRQHEGYSPDVLWIIDQGDPDSYLAAARAINAERPDVVMLQHEFGLYGYRGTAYVDHLVPFLRALTVPLVTTLHSIYPTPSVTIRSAADQLLSASAYVIVMTNYSRALLAARYGAPAAAVRVIPHGAPVVADVPRDVAKVRLGLETRPLLLSAGFIHPRKGLDSILRALPTVLCDVPDLQYLIVGRVSRSSADGCGYLSSLLRIIRELGLSQSVAVIDKFVTDRRLLEYMSAADVVVTPYPGLHQATSGILMCAMACGATVVASPYAHAREALAEDRGVIVDPSDVRGLASVLSTLLRDDERRNGLSDRALAYARSVAWPSIAAATSELLGTVVASGLRSVVVDTT
jgi:glycosyltransferase involved in cell wall biosynthesis